MVKVGAGVGVRCRVKVSFNSNLQLLEPEAGTSAGSKQDLTLHALILKSQHPVYHICLLPPGHWWSTTQPWGYRGSRATFHSGGRRCRGRSYRGVLLVWDDWLRCCCRRWFFTWCSLQQDEMAQEANEQLPEGSQESPPSGMDNQ